MEPTLIWILGSYAVNNSMFDVIVMFFAGIIGFICKKADIPLGPFILALLLGRVLVPALRALKAGQSIREVGPKWHQGKAGTPTMGGIVFILSSLLCIVTGWHAMR